MVRTNPPGKIKRTSKRTKPLGRPLKPPVDYETVDKLCAIQCTGAEIASFLGMHYDTLQYKVRQDHGIHFSEYIEQKRAGGKASLRRKQWLKGVDEGNVTMLIWLGKQYLGQSDMNTLKGQVESNIQHRVQYEYPVLRKILGDETFIQAEEQLLKAAYEAIKDKEQKLS